MEDRESQKSRVRQRRTAKNRMKRRARRVYPDSLYAEKCADHIQLCSCDMCCNVRRNPSLNGRYKLTFQEIKFLDQLKDSEKDL